ncbi:hypothetical protein CCYA_CCYA16G4082 [Cyanidiococcus yangmingshanensis]|nr:hypothetical protein CCYA_CCYA16G4082 [Cyanidiococcus yangmingshanensis]
MVRGDEAGDAQAIEQTSTATPLSTRTAGAEAGGYAKLYLKVFDPDTDQVATKEFLVQKLEVSLGRSVSADQTQAFAAAAEGVDLGAGFSNKLSRRHATIQWNQQQQRFEVYCSGKNGVLVVHADTFRHMRPGDEPEPLDSYSTIMLGDCLVVLLLPKATRVLPGASLSPARGRHAFRPAQGRPWMQRATLLRHGSAVTARDWHRVRSKWSKIDQETLLRGLMRYGYGRWKEIVQHAESGRLDRKPLDEMIMMARRMVIMAALHVTGAEYRAMLRILSTTGETRSSTASMVPMPRQIEQEVTMVAAEMAEAKLEKRKYVRWARRFRLLHRIERLVRNANVMQQIEQEKLEIPGKLPSDRWGGIDDADLLRGVYSLGFGDFNRFWEEPTLHFRERFQPPQGAASNPPDDGALSEQVATRADDLDEDEDVDEPAMSKTTLRSNTFQVDEEPTPVGAAAAMTYSLDTVTITKETSVKPERSPAPWTAETGTQTTDVAGVTLQGPPPASTAADDDRPPFPSSVELIRRLRILVNAAARLIESRKKDEPLSSALAAFAAEWPRTIDEASSSARQHDSKRWNTSRTAEQRALLASRLAPKVNTPSKDDPSRIEWARYRLEKAQRFTRKQAMEFERSLVNHGLDYNPNERPDQPEGVVHDWVRFVHHCAYAQYKLPDALEEAYIELVRECYRVLASASVELPHQATGDPNASEEPEDEQEQDAANETPPRAAAGRSPNPYASVSPESSIDPEMLERARSFAPSALFRDLDRKRARKALTRLHLFRVLRVYVLAAPEKSLAELVRQPMPPSLASSSSTVLSSDLPPWWRAVHDRALLYGIDRHGLGLGAFERIAQDHELGFPQSIETYCATRQLDGATVSRLQLGFPRVHVALRRARTVMDSVCAAMQVPPLPTESSLYVDEARRAALARARQLSIEANWMERLVHQYLAENEARAGLTPTLNSNLESMRPLQSISSLVGGSESALDSEWPTDEQQTSSARQPRKHLSTGVTRTTVDAQRRHPLVRSKRRRHVFEQLRAQGYIAQGLASGSAEVLPTQPVDVGNGLVLLSLGAFPSATADRVRLYRNEGYLLPPGFHSVRQLSASGHWYETRIETASSSSPNTTSNGPVYRVQQVEFVFPEQDKPAECLVPVADGFAKSGPNLNELWIQVMNSEAETGLAPGTASFVTLVSGFERAGLGDPFVQRCLRNLPNAHAYLADGEASTDDFPTPQPQQQQGQGSEWSDATTRNTETDGHEVAGRAAAAAAVSGVSSGSLAASSSFPPSAESPRNEPESRPSFEANDLVENRAPDP